MSNQNTNPIKSHLNQGALPSWISLLMAALITLGWLGAFLLLSPPEQGNVSGQIPWASGSLLYPMTQALSLWGSFPTARGVEIKDIYWHGVVVFATLLLAVRALSSKRHLNLSETYREPWMAGQILLIGWCLLALASTAWSKEPLISLGQAILYCFGVVWAVAIAWTLERNALRLLGRGILVSSALMAVLTIWYFFERNPNHRPGFPMGNPSPLATAMVPAILLAGCTLVIELWQRLMTGTWRDMRGCGLSALVLIPLIWAFLLADALTAKVALLVGAGVLLWHAIPGKSRWLVAAIAFVSAAGAIAYRFAAADDFGMARGASARLRLYTWRYAAELWEQAPMLGLGAGAYPRLANVLSIRDEQLDPAAFMGTWRNHAHNELFEIFTEIGLVGGVTFVGGHLATLLAALLVLRQRISADQRTVIIALLAAYIGIFADSFGSVSLRLPGFGIVFFTLIGVLWAVGRWARRGDLTGDALESFLPASQGAIRWLTVRRTVMALGVLVVGCGLGTAAWFNARSLWHEQRAYAAMAEGLPDLARGEAQRAEPLLLDPSRRILAVELQARARAIAAINLFVSAQQAPGGMSALPAAEYERMAQALRLAYIEVEAFDERIPAVGEMPILGAELAERYAKVLEPNSPEMAKEWSNRAMVAWSSQRVQNKYDPRACLALTRYNATPATHGVYLRDALRRSTPNDPAWLAGLQRVVKRYPVPLIDQIIKSLLESAGPIDPLTDDNVIIISMAPEAYRLGAAWWSFRGQHQRALKLASRAADLYQPIQDRFPTRLSVTFSEQAEYAFRLQPTAPQMALQLIGNAVRALPDIQVHERAKLERPLRAAEARYMIAAGQQSEAEALLEAWGWRQPSEIAKVYQQLLATVLRQPIERRPTTVIPWIERLVSLGPDKPDGWRWLAWLVAEQGHFGEVENILSQAQDAGLSSAEAEHIKRWLQTEFQGYANWNSKMP